MAGSRADAIREVGYEELYYRELPRLIALGFALSGDREVGRDLAQEALLRAFRGWREVGSLDAPGAWVRRVLINLSIDQRRRAGREASAMRQLRSEPTSTSGPYGDVEDFWLAVRDLPPRQRSIVALRYVEDLTIAGIAKVLGASIATVNREFAAARAALAERLGIEDGTDDDDR